MKTQIEQQRVRRSMQGTVLVKFFCKTYTVNKYRRCLTRFAKAFMLMVYKQNFLLT